MTLSGLHLIFTYRCTRECDHCFVWGSPRQHGRMTLPAVLHILQQAKDLETIEWLYFEGGEPFLYRTVLLKGVQIAAGLGFHVGIVSNGFWATDVERALEWLRPFAGLIQDLTISSDRYHEDEEHSQHVKHARTAAEQLGIPVSVISIVQPEAMNTGGNEQLPDSESIIMYRGRASEELVTRAIQRSWTEFTACPYENLREPGRVHVDPFGNVHICQGVLLGNIFQTPLREVCEGYDADAHPITGPLLQGGPAELVRRYDLPHEATYADACHLCYEARRALRGRFPEILQPDQVYGVLEAR